MISLDCAIQLLLLESHQENVMVDCNLELPTLNDIQHVKYKVADVLVLIQHMQDVVLLQSHLFHQEFVSEEKFHLPYL